MPADIVRKKDHDKLDKNFLLRYVINFFSEIDIFFSMLSFKPGRTIPDEDVLSIRLSKSLLMKYKSSPTKRTSGTTSIQLHTGLRSTGVAGKHIKHFILVFNDSALSAEEFLSLSLNDKYNVKARPFIEEKTANKIFENPRMENMKTSWLLGMKDHAMAFSPQRFQAMMDATEPIVGDNFSMKLRLVDELPFTNLTINYVESNIMKKEEIVETSQSNGWHYDENDLLGGFAITESFTFGDINGGNFVAKFKGEYVVVPTTNIIMGTLHSIKHKVMNISGKGFRGSFIAQINKEVAETARILRKSPTATIFTAAEKDAFRNLGWLA